MARAGGLAHRPAVLGPYNLLDFGTGVMAAFAATLGIYRQVTTGRGEHLWTSLTQTGTYHQGRHALAYEGKAGEGTAGPEALGEGPLQRFYRARDGWFFLGAGPERRAAVRRAAGVGELTEEELEAAFRSRSVVECVGELRAAGAGAHAVVSLPELMADPSVRAQGLAVQQWSEEVGEVTMPGVAIRLSDTPVEVGTAVRQPGGDGRLVLDGLGWGDAAERLEREWALQLEDLPAGWERR
jgi:crotonobetainyl-CoA:carnitine CoA-transferase CaiB-like acyl-CoA transferase